MRILGLSSLLLLLAACQPGAGSEKTPGSNTEEDACSVSPAACDEDGDGYKPSQGDCDDSDSSVNPAQVETCNGRDDNCDGQVDEDVGTIWYKDYDQDGFGDPDSAQTACEQPEGYVSSNTDCDDAQPRAFPGLEESCDGIDNNCDGTVDEGVTTTWYADADSDGYGDPASGSEACEAPSGYVLDNTDCDDSSAKSYPGNPEICDTLDNDCNGRVDEGVQTTYWADVDKDTYGDSGSPQLGCALPTGYAYNDDDCNDANAAVSPAATELCNGIDDDCDGGVDETDAADALVWYADNDGDTYGDLASPVTACFQPAGYVADATDCDDARAATYPGATEYCNGIDDDCDGTTDEPDAVDASTWYADSDTDTFGDAATSIHACTSPAGYVADATDCDDRDATSFPGGTEVCDGADNDCDGVIDNHPVDGNTYYADADSDGFGDEGSTVSECSLPAGYVENTYDCNDADAGEPAVADAYRGSASGSGTLTDPYASIQDAVDDAFECVLVYQGTYAENVDLGGKDLDVWGLDGSEFTTIDPGLTTCSSANPTDCKAAVEINSGSGASAHFHGFTIQGGTGSVSSTTSSETCADSSVSHTGTSTCTVTTYTYCGGGIHVDGDDPTFDDLIIYANTLPVTEQASTGSFTQAWLYSYGGGLCVVDGNVTADDVWVINNYADAGGGVYLGASSTLSYEHGIIGENDASDGAGLMASDATVATTDAVIACNEATTDGGGVFLEAASTLSVVNVSFFENASASSGSARGSEVWAPSTATVSIVNSIAEGDFANALLYGAAAATLQYNNAYNADSTGYTYGGVWAPGAGSISSGSNFTRSTCDGNAYNDDWTLKSTSKSINTGNPAAGYYDADGSKNDMGAYGGPAGSW